MRAFQRANEWYYNYGDLQQQQYQRLLQDEQRQRQLQLGMGGMGGMGAVAQDGTYVSPQEEQARRDSVDMNMQFYLQSQQRLGDTYADDSATAAGPSNHHHHHHHLLSSPLGAVPVNKLRGGKQARACGGRSPPHHSPVTHVKGKDKEGYGLFKMNVLITTYVLCLILHCLSVWLDGFDMSAMVLRAILNRQWFVPWRGACYVLSLLLLTPRPTPFSLISPSLSNLSLSLSLAGARYETLLADSDVLSGIKWRMLVVDEVGR